MGGRHTVGGLLCAAVVLQCLYLGSGLSPVDIILNDASKNGSRPLAMETIRAVMKSLRQNVPPDMARKLLRVEMSTSCTIGMVRLGRAIENLETWVFRCEYTTCPENALVRAGIAVCLHAQYMCSSRTVKYKYMFRCLGVDGCRETFICRSSQSSSIFRQYPARPGVAGCTCGLSFRLGALLFL